MLEYSRKNLYFIIVYMEIQIKIHIGNDLTDSKEVVERLVWENLNNKLDQYLNKFTKNDAEGTIELTTDKNKKGLFDAKIQASLDDLINHLFDHFKEALSKEK